MTIRGEGRVVGVAAREAWAPSGCAASGASWGPSAPPPSVCEVGISACSTVVGIQGGNGGSFCVTLGALKMPGGCGSGCSNQAPCPPFAVGADDVRLFAFVRFTTGDAMSKRSKFALITWIGENVSGLQRAKTGTDKTLVKEVVQVTIFVFS